MNDIHNFTSDYSPHQIIMGKNYFIKINNFKIIFVSQYNCKTDIFYFTIIKLIFYLLFIEVNFFVEE